MSRPARQEQFARRAVSRRRRWLGAIALLILVGLLGGYRHLTRPERVRVYAERFLETMSGGIVRIEAARFDLFDGLHLSGVAIATPPDPAQPTYAATFEDRLIFSARDLFLRLQPFSVITGDLVVPEIVATDPRIRLLRDQRTDARNWRQLLVERRHRPARAARNPTIRLRNARIQLAWTPNPAQHTAGDFPLDVTAACPADQPTLYDIRWRTRSPPTEDGRFLFDTRTLELRTAEGGLPTIPMASVRWASPRDLDAWLNLLDLSGQIRTDRLSYSPEQGGRAELAIERASIAAIVSEEDRALPRQDRYLTFSDVHGRLAFAGAAVEVTLEGKWRGGVCRLSGRLFGNLASVRSLDDVGFELEVQAENVLLPNLPGRQSPAEARFIQRWEKLGDVIRLFRPEGRVDLNFAVGKPLGHGRKPVFRGGEIIARGSSAAYLAFPYRISDLSGRVRILPEGPVVYDNLKGRHGDATVVVNGRQTESRWACGLDLHIRGDNVALDDDLRACLDDRYQAIWENFRPSGSATLEVLLTRPPSPTREPAPMRSQIVAGLRGVSACYRAFPVPLTDAEGILEIESDRFTIRGIQTRYHDASVWLQGTVVAPPDETPDVNLDITACGVPLDGRLADALPLESRRAFDSLRIPGCADIDARVFTDESGELAYDARARLSFPAFCLDAYPLDFRNADALVLARPGHLRVARFTATHEAGTVELDGANGTAAEPILLRARRLPLTPQVFAALPPRAKEIWQFLRPEGDVDVDATLPALLNDAAAAPPLEVEIRPHRLSLSPASIPLTADDITGRFVVVGDRLELHETSARIAAGAVHLDGIASWSLAGWHASLTGRAEALHFEDSVRRSLPWRLQRIWNAVRPSGTVDAVVRRLSLRQAAGRPLEWQLDGRFLLHDVDFAGAGTVTDVDGEVDLAAESSADGSSFGLQGTARVSTMRFGERQITNASAVLRKDASDTLLHASDIRASMYSGEMRGFAEFDLRPNRNTYGMSLTVENVRLAEFLRGPAATTQPGSVRGLVSGKVFLSGTLGDVRTRRGGGNLAVSEAQVMRMPVFLSVISVLNLAKPDENAFHEGSVDFSLQGETLTLRAVDLRGSAISLVGAGRMETRDRSLDVALLAGSPHRLPRLGLLSELAEATARELLEVHVGGTLDNPVVTSRPLPGVARAVDLVQKWRERAEK